MNDFEILVIVMGLFLGYIIVAALMNVISPKESSKSHYGDDSNSSQKNSDTKSSHHENSNKQAYENQGNAQLNWFRILEVSETATMSEIGSQYKRKIREYHPDKVASLGKELKDLAEFKSKEINSAYEFAKKLRG